MNSVSHHHPSRGFSSRIWLAWFALMLGIIGCSSGDGLDRREVRGTVTMNGEPVEQGSITLFPLAKGPVASGRITNGTFQIEREYGPIPGEYRVEITGQKSTGKMIRVEEPGVEPREIPEVKSIVPGEYNDRSELRITIVETDSVIEKNFDLKSPSPPGGQALRI